MSFFSCLLRSLLLFPASKDDSFKLFKYSKDFFWIPIFIPIFLLMELPCLDDNSGILWFSKFISEPSCFSYLLLLVSKSIVNFWPLKLFDARLWTLAIGGNWKTLASFYFSYSISKKEVSFLLALLIFIYFRFLSISFNVLFVSTDWDLSSEAFVRAILFITVP